MQFCPVGYFTIPDAVRKVWVALHPGEERHAVAELKEHQSGELPASYYRASQHIDEAEKLLLQALVDAELVALVKVNGDDWIVPPEYWKTDGARVVTLLHGTLHTGTPDCREYHRRPCFIGAAPFQQWLDSKGPPVSLAEVPRPGGTEAFEETYWNLLQVLAWVSLRDRELVCKAADDATPPVTTLRFDIMATIRAASRRAVFCEREDAEQAVRYAAQAEKLTVTGLKNGHGDRMPIPGPFWADLVFKHPHSSPPYATSRDADFNAAQWHRLMFRRSEVLAILPAVQAVPTVTFLDMARVIGADPTHERNIDDTLRQLRDDAVLNQFRSGCLGWNARENLRRLGPSSATDLVGFDPVTPIQVIRQLAELEDAAAEAVLNLSDAEACRRVAEAELPPKGSRARVFIESLVITKSEARRFCKRHGRPVPDRLWESPITWSETARTDAITMTEMPRMPIIEVARRWSNELGGIGRGEDAIRQTIWQAFWHGALACNEGLIIPLNRHDSQSTVDRFTRAKFLLTISAVADLAFPLERPPESDTEGHVSDATESDYGRVADHWDEIVSRMEPSGWREVYIDPSMLEREPFLAWCKEAGRDPPAFWTRTPTSADQSTRARTDTRVAEVGHWLAQDRLELKIVINIARGALPRSGRRARSGWQGSAR
jgi:hypothetical protein